MDAVRRSSTIRDLSQFSETNLCEVFKWKALVVGSLAYRKETQQASRDRLTTVALRPFDQLLQSHPKGLIARTKEQHRLAMRNGGADVVLPKRLCATSSKPG